MVILPTVKKLRICPFQMSWYTYPCFDYNYLVLAESFLFYNPMNTFLQLAYFGLKSTHFGMYLNQLALLEQNFH